MVNKFWIRLSLILIVLFLADCSTSGAATRASPTTLPLEALPVTSPQKMVASPTVATAQVSSTGGFTLTSPDVKEGGTLPAEYTCDGAANTLALFWNGAPARTQGYAVIMHHEASPTDIHWYWVVYNIPVDVTSLPKNMTGVGTLGNNSVNDKQAYTPPCSKGPGPKTYTYTVYALSAQPQLSVPANKVTRAVLLDAIRDITLASAELHVTYTRK